MSYGFKIVRDADGVHQLEIQEGSRAHLPDVIHVSGHHVKVGELGYESVSVSVTEVDPAIEYLSRAVLQAEAGTGRDRR